MNWSSAIFAYALGDFNVPIGDRLPKQLWKCQELYCAAEVLQNATLLNVDFETTLGGLGKKDFAFIDPPYPRGASDEHWFNRYCKDFFTLEDHDRLGKIIAKQDKRGTRMMILLGDDRKILRCYPNWFKRRNLHSRSLISGNPSSRRVAREVVLTNYVRA